MDKGSVVEFILFYSSFFGSNIFAFLSGFLILYLDVVVGVFYFIALIFSYLITVIIRLLYYKPRPKKIENKGFMTRISESSFPSAHIQRAILIAYYLFVLYPFSLLFSIFFVVLVGVSRVFKERHYSIDVYGGVFVILVILVFVELFRFFLF